MILHDSFPRNYPEARALAVSDRFASEIMCSAGGLLVVAARLAHTGPADRNIPHESSNADFKKIVETNVGPTVDDEMFRAATLLLTEDGEQMHVKCQLEALPQSQAGDFSAISLIASGLISPSLLRGQDGEIDFKTLTFQANQYRDGNNIRNIWDVQYSQQAAGSDYTFIGSTELVQTLDATTARLRELSPQLF